MWPSPVSPRTRRIPPARLRQAPSRRQIKSRRLRPIRCLRLSRRHRPSYLPDRTLHFKAKAGAIRLSDAQSGAPLADIGFIAFMLDGTDPAKRPVTFAINGGPGAGSGWLDLGAMGPWRLPMTGAARTPSAAPVPVPNADTWLDFTDLVFIDPPGTGYSRILSKDDARRRASIRSMATSTASPSSSANGSPKTNGSKARNSSSAKAMAGFARLRSPFVSRIMKASASTAS